MFDLKLTVQLKGYGNIYRVSIQESTPHGLEELISPSYITGEGTCYSEALENFIKQFDEYLDDLKRFRGTILDSKQAYANVVELDCFGTPKIKQGGINFE